MQYRAQGFTLVFEEFEHLSDRIQSMIRAFNGQVMFDKRFNNTITLQFMETMAVFLKNESDAGLN